MASFVFQFGLCILCLHIYCASKEVVRLMSICLCIQHTYVWHFFLFILSTYLWRGCGRRALLHFCDYNNEGNENSFRTTSENQQEIHIMCEQWAINSATLECKNCGKWRSGQVSIRRKKMSEQLQYTWIENTKKIFLTNKVMHFHFFFYVSHQFDSSSKTKTKNSFRWVFVFVAIGHLTKNLRNN